MDDNLQERRKHIVSFQCDPRTTARLAELARRGDRTLSAEIRRAVREHIDHQLPGAPPLDPEPIERRGADLVGPPAAARGEDAA
jgi:hypothetical protein